MRRHKPDNDSKVSLPITPMLDMTFQLLFFFITSFNPADQEGQLDMALPSEAVTQAHKQEDVKKDSQPDKNFLEFPSDLTVKVRTQNDGINDGEISALFVQTIGGNPEPINGELPGLVAYLTKKRDEGTNKDNIKVQGDSKLKVSNLIKVMDACRKAGFTNVSMVSPEDFGR